MFLLKMIDSSSNALGLTRSVTITIFHKSINAKYSWFPVHTTSLNNTNDLISGDNKGYASYLMEQLMNNGALPGKVHPVALEIVSNVTYNI